jgi:hypothetical protein
MELLLLHEQERATKIIMGDTYYMEEPTTIDRRSLCKKDMQCELEVQGSTREYPRQIIMCEVQRVELDLGSTATMDDIAC